MFSFADNGPCLGSRKPNQPYEWQSYKEVRCGPGKWESDNLPVLNAQLYGRVSCVCRWQTGRSTSALLCFTEDTLTRETSLSASFPRTDRRYDRCAHPLHYRCTPLSKDVSAELLLHESDRLLHCKRQVLLLTGPQMHPANTSSNSAAISCPMRLTTLGPQTVNSKHVLVESRVRIIASLSSHFKHLQYE